MGEIKLTKNRVTLVDDEDFEYLNSFKWYICNKGYAVRLDPCENRRQVRLHRVVVNNPTGQSVDHINRDKLDNRKSNLRVCSNKDNVRNSPSRKGSSSIYKGVSFDKSTNSWRSRIRVDYKGIDLGRHEIEVEAALAYNKAAKEYFGEFVYLNKV